MKAVLVRSNPYNNRRLSDPAYDSFWAEARELDCTIALHAAVTGDMPTAGFDRYHDFFQRMIIWKCCNFEKGVREDAPRETGRRGLRPPGRTAGRGTDSVGEHQQR